MALQVICTVNMTELCIVCNSASCQFFFFFKEWTRIPPPSAKVNRRMALELLKEFDAIVQAVNLFFN